MPKFFAKAAWLSGGWTDDVLLSVNDSGIITDVAQDVKAQDAILLDGPIIPGMPNLHSHAFQRAMAGMSEYMTDENDSFWTWRTLMYDFVQKLDAEALEDIAIQLYREMLRAGYTHVGEFHYIHHDMGGAHYEDKAHLAHAMISAAKKAGIGMTLLPVLYAHGGFGGQEPNTGQRRFINNAHDFVKMLSDLQEAYRDDPMVEIGMAFHSLRAVTPDMIAEVTRAAKAINPDMPIHIHVAEQVKEVEDCQSWSGKRPVEWLMENAPVDENWCLVHATHMTEAETKAVAKSGAVAGICPVTEGNLGDGFFNLPDYISHGGRWGIGSDSHISVDPWEELRWLEYGQRLLRRERAVAKTKAQPHVGNYLFESALQGGAQVMSNKIGALAIGKRADFLVLDSVPEQLDQKFWIDALIFAGNIRVKQVYCAGKIFA